MKKVTILLAAVVFAAFTSFASNGNTGGEAPKTLTVTGKVVDKNNQEAIAGALVKVKGTEIEVYSDFEGNFTIEGLAPDTYTINCSMISYPELEEEIKIAETTKELEIKLETLTK